MEIKNLLFVIEALFFSFFFIQTCNRLIDLSSRGRNLSPAHLKLGLSWAVNILAQKNWAKFGPVRFRPA